MTNLTANSSVKKYKDIDWSYMERFGEDSDFDAYVGIWVNSHYYKATQEDGCDDYTIQGLENLLRGKLEKAFKQGSDTSQSDPSMVGIDWADTEWSGSKEPSINIKEANDYQFYVDTVDKDIVMGIIVDDRLIQADQSIIDDIKKRMLDIDSLNSKRLEMQLEEQKKRGTALKEICINLIRSHSDLQIIGVRDKEAEAIHNIEKEIGVRVARYKANGGRHE